LKDRFPQLEEKVMSNKKLDSDEVKTILQFIEQFILKGKVSHSNADA